ncbi:RNA polymerase sigma-54 factor [Tabrizicola sp. TH137]|uniref:RNA polymerase factor sigma-54 n=1 Tax=Tabrizicola sp. TH137 TaxID=2067452 RepID=UPI000C7CC41E|nr:RNA polymerase factor sigma-54 [Tabrizicola sp. TH137]PLL12109.1 RNA polymerase sigma-54 factor [Tabrizicola sp. TH137]
MQLFTSQSIGQRQSVVVTAQLQQAIQLLQMGNTDLASFIESQAEENPFLELGARAAQPKGASTARDLTLPSQLRSGEDDWDKLGQLAADPGPSLYAHAAAEVARLGLSPRESMMAEAFLDALEPSGWLGQSLSAIADRLLVDESEVEALLHRLHQVEPAGLFARNLAECLRLQARDQGLLTPAFATLLDNLPMLAQADLRGLCRVCGVSMDDLKAMLRHLRSFNPKPGATFDAAPMPQRAPDLLVTRGPDGWRVDLNRSTLPTVVVREGEARRLSLRRIEANAYVSERLSVARWLSRAVEHRNQTTLKVGAEVVRRQTEFLEHGPSRLRPMVLREVAEAIGVHESTVSRVCSGILIATPQGTFPLKSFFSAALAAREGEGGEAGSAAAIRHRIQKLIAAENPEEPLSDDIIARVIGQEDGIQLARRTVAKYRDQLRIASSVDRRRRAMMTKV